MADGREKPYMTPGEVAQLLMVTPMTIRRWVKQGDLVARTTAGGHRRFLKRDVERFARQRGMSLPLADSRVLRVLVVDDNVEFAEYIVEALTALPSEIEVQCAHDGFAAGMMVRDFRPHVVLLDLMMSKMNGFDVCRELKGNPATNSADVIALTGYYTEENARRIMECGARACLPKPIRLGALVEALGLDVTAQDVHNASLVEATTQAGCPAAPRG